MKNIIAFLRNKHQDIFRIILILIAILLITNFFPKYGQFKYVFEEGKPWRHEDLRAPASFPIIKSEKEIDQEKQKIIQDIHPYYIKNNEVAKQQREKFIKDFSNQLAQLKGEDVDSAALVRNGLNIIDSLYAQGVIQLDERHKGLPKDFSINVITENEVHQRQLRNFRNMAAANQFVEDTLAKVQLEETQVLQNAIKKVVRPSIIYDSTTTRTLRENAFADISQYRDKVQEGEIIVRRGDPVTQERFQKIISYREHVESQQGERNRLMINIGYFILTTLLMTIFGAFIFIFAPSVFKSTRKLLFILVLIVVMLYLVSWAVRAGIPSYYVIPYCIVPIILRTFFGTRLALYAHLIILLLASFIVPLGIEYTALNIVAGMVAIFTNIKAHYWSQFFISIGFIFLTYSVGFLGIAMIQEGNLTSIQLLDFGWLSINVFLTLMAYPLIPIFEKLFGYVSDITLMELGDLNKPLLKELSLKAPGTFQHSLQVANLAEAAASEIGANSLLVKVGSLYHDIGKMENPIYFIENQNTNYNPHDELPFEESAQIIINHVIKGVEMAKKGKLPEVLIDFIRTHHGTSRVEYFYRSYIKRFPEKDVDDTKFRYPGPLPYSKETAIVMMADSVEAAARSIKAPTLDGLNQLVDNIINHKIQSGQFINANITFKEITIIKKVLKKMLHSIYHVRIEYPEEVKKEEAQ